MPGRDLSADLYGDAPAPAPAAAQSSGRDLSADLYGNAPAKKAPKWSEVPLQAAKNLLPSAGNLIGGVWHAVTHPIDTAGDMLDVGAGALRNALPASVSSAIDKLDPGQNAAANQQRISSYANAAGKFVGDRYGSADALKNTLATDPVGAALDISTVLTGGGALATKIPALAKAGEATKVVGNAVNPINAAAAGAARIGPAVVRKLVDQEKMAQRIAELKAGGVDNPSLGLATGNKFISGLENLLSHTPGAMGLYERAQETNVAGMRAKTEGIRDAISSEYGPVVAGEAIQGDLKGTFRQRTKETAKKLADRVGSLVGGDTVVPVDNALSTATRLATPIPGAESTSAAFINPRIAGIAENLRTDVYGALPASTRPLSGNPTANIPQAQSVANSSLWNAPSRPVSNPSLWNAEVGAYEPLPQRPQNIGRQDIPNASLWNAQKEQGIPFAALKQLRTSIGEETQSNAIMGTPEQAQFKQLYGALSEDMRNAAGAADRARAGVPMGPLQMADQPATVAMSRANQHFSTAMNRAEQLDGLANRSTPEGAYSAVANSLKAGPTIYERLRSAITPEARQKVVATVVNDMGYAGPGLQNAEGSVWSARSFLSNYNRLDTDARSALFTRLPGGQTYADNLSKVANAAEMMGDSAKVWANPSGTSHAIAARGAIGTVGLGLVGGVFFAPLLAPAAMAGGTMLAAHQVSQRLLLNPKFVNWLAKSTNVPAAQMPAYSKRLLANARLSGDKQFQQDASIYLDAIQEASQQGSY